MTWLKKYNTIEEWQSIKEELGYPFVGLIEEDNSVQYLGPRPIHQMPIKAVFYDSASSSFVKLYPGEITEKIPTYTPIGVEVIPAEHDVYGTGQAGIMSLALMDYKRPDVGSSTGSTYWGAQDFDTGLTNYNKSPLRDGSGSTASGSSPSDGFTGSISSDRVTRYPSNSQSVFGRPSPYNSDGSRNETFYTTANFDFNSFSDFEGLENTSLLINLATSQSNWKTASTITNSYDEGYYPAACCCWRFHTAGTSQGQWYLPACGEVLYANTRRQAINTTINKVLSVYSSAIGIIVKSSLGSSTEYSATYAGTSSNTMGYGVTPKYYTNPARAFIRL